MNIYMNAFIDPLTGVLNRRGAHALLFNEFEYKHEIGDFGIIIIDIDYFKKHNDLLGHDEGDYCLKTVAEIIRECVKERTELIIRHGGEEFVVLLANSDKNDTVCWAEKIRSTINDRRISTPFKEIADFLTVSIGASIVSNIDDMHYESVVYGADQALYSAKMQGRNQVVFKNE
jgi:diguanylate cyclase (GGDEF) domain